MRVKQFLKSKRKFGKNLNADSKVKVNVTGVEIFGVHGKVLSQGMCVPNIKGLAQIVWQL